MEIKASLTLRKYEEAVKYLFNRTGISFHTKYFLLYHIGIAIYLYEYISVFFSISIIRLKKCYNFVFKFLYI